MARLPKILTLGLVVAVAAACGPGGPRQTLHSSSSQSRYQLISNGNWSETYDSPTYTGPIASDKNYVEPGIYLQPPQSSSSPSASYNDAFSDCTTGANICAPGYPISISLAVATDDQAGQEGASGSIIPVMNATLVYVVSQTGIPCIPVGPGGGGSSTTIPTYHCTVLEFVDANSGKALYAVSSPGL